MANAHNSGFEGSALSTTIDTTLSPSATTITQPEITANANTLVQAGTAAREKIQFVPLIRVYAMCMVVFIHVASIPAPHFKTIGLFDWWTSMAYHALSKGGPPLFTMVSGMLLLAPRDEQPILVFFRKRFIKVLLPFLGWAVVYLAWRVYFNGESLTLAQGLREIIQGPVYYHLWFIQMILGLYLATPILRVYVRHASRQNLSYFILIWFLGVSILPLSSRFLKVNPGIQLVVTTNFVGYFILGYFLRNVTLTPRQLYPAALTVAASVGFTEVSTYILMKDANGNLDTFFLDNHGFNIVLMSAGLFLFLKSLPYQALYTRYPTAEKAINLLASCSLGIYFVHVMIMELLGSGKLGFQIGPLSFNPLFAVPITSAVTFGVSFVVILALKRIPVINFMVP